MRPDALQRIAWFSVALATIGMLAVGLHHIRCQSTFVHQGGMTTEESVPCAETYPGDLLPFSFALALAGGLVAIASAVMLLRGPSRTHGARALLALGAATLVIPGGLALAGWASIGFDVGILAPGPGAGYQCSGGAGFADPPIWLQTPTCVARAELVLVPVIALVGALGGVAAWRADRRIALGALALAALGIGIVAVIAIRDIAPFGYMVTLASLGLAGVAAGALRLPRPAA